MEYAGSFGRVFVGVIDFQNQFQRTSLQAKISKPDLFLECNATLSYIVSEGTSLMMAVTSSVVRSIAAASRFSFRCVRLDDQSHAALRRYYRRELLGLRRRLPDCSMASSSHFRIQIYTV